jgi:hypothetical protein
LQQVILNLFVNAIEAMSGVTENQRELHVSSQKITENRSASGQETIDSKAPGEQGLTSLLIVVRDAGPGLDSTELKHVSRPSIPPNLMGWVWAWQLAVRSSKLTMDVSGSRQTRHEAQFFSSSCHASRFDWAAP